MHSYCTIPHRITLSSMALHKELLPSYVYAVDRNFPQGTFFGPQIFFFSLTRYDRRCALATTAGTSGGLLELFHIWEIIRAKKDDIQQCLLMSRSN